ncbi:hypothetical protein FC682_25395 [Peribacillus simplex]|uniref:hypothetical protein n=1 Tax=Peribacillus simplex TaxID=1478 RepID=UPI0010BE33EC|nr:hypothetical protein [Peribacillus simplex]TKG99548.1 hypothetical protein FC682_25395 [Peribacillus simplex]
MKDLFEEAPQSLSLYHLIALLFFDFLERPMIEKRVLKQMTTYLFSFEQREEEIEVTSVEKRAEITLRIKESEIYRGEVLLHDIFPYLIDEEWKVEDLLVILFIDFLKRIKYAIRIKIKTDRSS